MTRFLPATVAVLACLSPAFAGPDALPEPATRDMFPTIDIQQAMLGRSLFFDPILSGNQNIACATCHHPTLGTSDGMALSIGEGGEGLGPNRVLARGDSVHARIPRNAPALWNKGAKFVTTLFHDGRVEVDPSSPHGIRVPSPNALERPVMNPLAAQALFPITSAEEMAGGAHENPVGAAAAAGEIMGDGAVWAQLAARVEAVPAYRTAFDWLIGPGERVHITDIANALSAFMTFEFRSTDSPFDAYLRGDESALSPLAIQGMELFYGEAGCSGCHAGTFQTDQAFHAMGMPQIGPGKGHVDGRPYADIGRAAISGDDSDLYAFRTPSLRNVTLTAPYGHAGAYATLEAVVRHHMAPTARLSDYDAGQALLLKIGGVASDFTALNDAREQARILDAVEIDGVSLTEDQIPAILAFLEALEDPIALTGRLGVPESVMSGLPMDTVLPLALASSQPVERNPRRFSAVREVAQVPMPDRGPVQPAPISISELIRIDLEIGRLSGAQ